MVKDMVKKRLREHFSRRDYTVVQPEHFKVSKMILKRAKSSKTTEFVCYQTFKMDDFFYCSIFVSFLLAQLEISVSGLGPYMVQSTLTRNTNIPMNHSRLSLTQLPKSRCKTLTLPLLSILPQLLFLSHKKIKDTDS